MTQARIDAQAARVNRRGKHFADGNRIMSELIGQMTPPAPTGTCSDLASSAALTAGGRFPLGSGEAALLTVAGFPAPAPTAQAGTGTSTGPAPQGNQAGVNYPRRGIQDIMQELVPPACTNRARPLPGATQQPNSNTALWVLGALAAAALLFAPKGGQ